MQFRTIGDPTLGMNSAPAAIAAMLGTTSVEDLGGVVTEDTEIRTTVWYREAGGGILIRARANSSDALPFLHLGISESACSGAICVFEWEGPWTKVTPAGSDMPKDPEPSFTSFEDMAIGKVFDRILERLRAYLKMQNADVAARDVMREAVRPLGMDLVLLDKLFNRKFTKGEIIAFTAIAKTGKRGIFVARALQSALLVLRSLDLIEEVKPKKGPSRHRITPIGRAFSVYLKQKAVS